MGTWGYRVPIFVARSGICSILVVAFASAVTAPKRMGSHSVDPWFAVSPANHALVVPRDGVAKESFRSICPFVNFCWV